MLVRSNDSKMIKLAMKIRIEIGYINDILLPSTYGNILNYNPEGKTYHIILCLGQGQTRPWKWSMSEKFKIFVFLANFSLFFLTKFFFSHKYDFGHIIS